MAVFRGLSQRDLNKLSVNGRRLAGLVAQERHARPYRVALWRALVLFEETCLFLFKCIAKACEGAPWFAVIPAKIIVLIIGFVLAAIFRTIFGLSSDNSYSRYIRALSSGRPRSLVLWFRKFHQSHDHLASLQHSFEELSKWGLIACTLSDEVVHDSVVIKQHIRSSVKQMMQEYSSLVFTQDDKISRAKFIANIICFSVSLIVLTPIIVAIAIATADRNFIYTLLIVSTILAISGTVVYKIYGVLVIYLYGWKKLVEGRRRLYRKRLNEITTVNAGNCEEYFQGLRSKLGEQSLSLEGGIIILRVPDADWQEVISSSIRHSAAIVIDITVISDNLLWEINKIKESGRINQVVFTIGLTNIELAQVDIESRHPSLPYISSFYNDQSQGPFKLFFYSIGSNIKIRSNIDSSMSRFASLVYESAASDFTPTTASDAY
jgi:hypothetical protein